MLRARIARTLTGENFMTSVELKSKPAGARRLGDSLGAS
jgi:hypothetical protein